MSEEHGDDAAATRWVSQSEAAQLLTAAGDAITQQQVSRYLDRWPEIPRRTEGPGRPTMLDFDALQRHRTQNVIVQERAAAKPTQTEDEGAELRIRERKAAAELRELELAKARDEVIPRASVQRAIAAAAVALQQAHQRTRFERAEQLEATRDARAKVTALTNQDTAIEAAFARALQALAAERTEEEEDQLAQEQEDEEAQRIETASTAPAAERSPSPS